MVKKVHSSRSVVPATPATPARRLGFKEITIKAKNPGLVNVISSHPSPSPKHVAVQMRLIDAAMNITSRERKQVDRYDLVPVFKENRDPINEEIAAFHQALFPPTELELAEAKAQAEAQAKVEADKARAKVEADKARALIIAGAKAPVSVMSVSFFPMPAILVPSLSVSDHAVKPISVFNPSATRQQRDAISAQALTAMAKPSEPVSVLSTSAIIPKNELVRHPPRCFC